VGEAQACVACVWRKTSRHGLDMRICLEGPDEFGDPMRRASRYVPHFNDRDQNKDLGQPPTALANTRLTTRVYGASASAVIQRLLYPGAWPGSHGSFATFQLG
jgi:hypothetical protein